MLHQNPKARLSSLCLAKTSGFKNALLKLLEEQPLGKEKQFTFLQVMVGKLCGEHSLSMGSLWTASEPLLPSSRPTYKAQAKGIWAFYGLSVEDAPSGMNK